MHELIALECAMEEDSTNTFLESFDTDTSFVVIIERIANAIRNIAASMVNYAQTIKLDIDKNISIAKMKIQINKMKKALIEGKTVYVPDIESTTNEYRKVVNSLRVEIKDITRELTRFRFRKSKRVGDYLERKDAFEARLDQLLDGLEGAINKRIEIKSTESGKIDVVAARMLKEASLYVNEYIRLIRDVEKVAIDFEKAAKQAEAFYDLRNSARSHISMLGKVRNTATKSLRKVVFVIGSFVL